MNERAIASYVYVRSIKINYVRSYILGTWPTRPTGRGRPADHSSIEATVTSRWMDKFKGTKSRLESHYMHLTTNYRTIVVCSFPNT